MSPERRDKEEKYEELERKYNIKKKGIRTVIEELKQRLHVKTEKLKRYEERINQYQINRMFVQNQKRVYQQMGETRNINNDKPNHEEGKQVKRSKKQFKKIPNWKNPGPDGVTGLRN